MVESVGSFRGKKIEDMDKDELIGVIQWLAEENSGMRQELYKLSDQRHERLIKDLKIRKD